METPEFGVVRGPGRRPEYARVLEVVFRAAASQLKSTLRLLHAPAVDAEAALLDSHLDQQCRSVEAVERALANLGRRGFLVLQASTARGARQPDSSALVDAVATWLLESLRRWPVAAMDLAVATGRLIEESPVLGQKSRLTTPLGRGFEPQLEERLRLRFELLTTQPMLLRAFEERRVLLLESPDEGIKEIERALGRRLLARERRWVDVERFAGMLAISRSTSRKTQDGQIRWFVRRDPDVGPVLDRYGARGHWLVAGSTDPSALMRAGTLAARVGDEEREQTETSWRALVLGMPRRASRDEPDRSVDAPQLDEAYALPLGGDDGRASSLGSVRRGLSPLALDVARRAICTAAGAADATAHRLRRRSYALVADGDELALTATAGAGGHRPLVRVALEPDDDALLDFMDVLARTAQAANVADKVGPQHRDAGAVRWARATLANLPERPASRPSSDLTGLDVRLVYVPAALPHPLGGLPLIGLRFVADGLERLGAYADVLTIRAHDLRRRCVELLGADVIGLSVYLTNRAEVARLVALLRDAGFAGKIVLGGPQLREIDVVQDETRGWDALVRGEGEEAFPQVLRVLRHLDAGELDEGLALARGLKGIAIAHRELTILANTAARNAVDEIVCPLPFEWQRSNEDGTLKMNFTRGCPYSCGFCPNHQGRLHHASPAKTMWAFTERAAADALRLPHADEAGRARAIQRALSVDGPPRLRPALNLLLRRSVPRELLGEICDLDADTVAELPHAVSPWEAKRRWLAAKTALLPTARILSGDAAPDDGDDERASLPAFELMTSEDNTLVARGQILDYMALRRASGLAEAIVFDPGQNTVRDLTDHRGGLDAAYIDALCDANPFKVVLGVDGTSNPILRQNGKPQYRVGDAVELNRALSSRGIEVLNNYILLTPETSLIEAIEALALFVILPIRWRDHGEAINLRITKEPGTRSHDEGLLFAPDDQGYNDPFRFSGVDDLLDRWQLTASVHSAHLPELLWRLLTEDPDAQRLLPQVVRRWERDFDRDQFLRDLAVRIRDAARPGTPLVDTLRMVADAYRRAWPGEPGGAERRSGTPGAVEREDQRWAARGHAAAGLQARTLTP